MKFKQGITLLVLFVALLVTFKAALATPVVSTIEFDEVERGTAVTTTFTITNDAAATIRSIAFDASAIAAKYNARVLPTAPATTLPTSLATGAQATITLEVTVPVDEDSGRVDAGNLQITSTAGTTKQAVFVNPISHLEMIDFEVNDKGSGDLSIEDDNEIYVEVRNRGNLDIEDVNVEVKILDVDNDDLEEDDEIGDLDADDEDDVTLDFSLRNEDIDEEEYTIEIIITGEDENGAEHETIETRKADIDLENHNLVIDSATLGNPILQDLQQTSLRVDILNLGKSDEEDIVLKISNTALGLNQERSNIELDEFTRRDNEESYSFTLDLEDAAPGKYPITIELFRDEDRLEDKQDLMLEIREPTVARQTTQDTTNVASQEAQALAALQAELERVLAQRDAQPTTAPIVRSSFRESSTYNALIGVLAVLALIALVLGVVVLTRKR